MFEPQIILAGPLEQLRRFELIVAREGVGRKIGVYKGKSIISIVGAGPFQLQRLLDDASRLGISEIVTIEDKEDRRKNGQARKRVRNRRKVAA